MDDYEQGKILRRSEFFVDGDENGEFLQAKALAETMAVNWHELSDGANNVTNLRVLAPALAYYWYASNYTPENLVRIMTDEANRTNIVLAVVANLVSPNYYADLYQMKGWTPAADAFQPLHPIDGLFELSTTPIGIQVAGREIPQPGLVRGLENLGPVFLRVNTSERRSGKVGNSEIALRESMIGRRRVDKLAQQDGLVFEAGYSTSPKPLMEMLFVSRQRFQWLQNSRQVHYLSDYKRNGGVVYPLPFDRKVISKMHNGLIEMAKDCAFYMEENPTATLQYFLEDEHGL